ncbi:MAG: hypothetical protein JXR73_13830 [Candidatus Omnitrophica bacterium]|nr:hypothetical protein [Candidatus Omnitrophota bacterium]
MRKQASLLVLCVLLGASIMLIGCVKEDASTSKSELGATSIQPTPTKMIVAVRSKSPEIPKILWDDRSAYEKEGQQAFFTDCGFYKGDTDELTGAKCEFKNGEWVLLEPKLEPKDNLIDNGDFSEWTEEKTSPIGIGLSKVASVEALISPETEDVLSKPYSLKYITSKSKGEHNQVNIGFGQNSIKALPTRKVTVILNYKLKSNANNFRLGVQVYTYNGEKWDYLKPVMVIKNGSLNKEWIRDGFVVKLPTEIDRSRIKLRMTTEGIILFDDLAIYLGNLPMLFNGND